MLAAMNGSMDVVVKILEHYTMDIDFRSIVSNRYHWSELVDNLTY